MDNEHIKRILQRFTGVSPRNLDRAIDTSNKIAQEYELDCKSRLLTSALMKPIILLSEGKQ